METLISNTEFGQLCKSKKPEFKTPLEYFQWYEKIRNNYDELLKQPLTLGMFVPCDEDGEVMDLKGIKQSVIEGTDSWDAYEEARERVLFHIEIPIDVKVIKYHIEMNRDVEYLANKDFPKIKLTETAKKQIGL